MSVEEAARKYALQNAVLHGGKANQGAVIGKLMAEMPELRSNPKEVMPGVKAVVESVNSLSPEQQRIELETLAPELLEKKKREKRTGLDDLEGVNENGVVMRFAPGPSGPLHIGHTRAAILNDEYVKRHGGRYFIRLEDTNPAKIDPEAYDTIFEDLDWLGLEYTDKAIQSDRFDVYLEHARKLIGLGQAYICDCDVEAWRAKKASSRPCPHRSLAPGAQLAAWDRMLDGSYPEGAASMVVKTDLAHPNPAVRDFVAFRIVEAPHPRTGTKYRVYPTYNFSVAVDDHLMGMTHVLRGKDHLNNTIRQQYVYRYFGWDEPAFIHYGWVSIEDTLLKTSAIREGIGKGEYTGWDDVRLGTLKAMAKRGIRPDAFRRYWTEVGIKEVDIRFSWETLYAYNKELVDPEAMRYFFVNDPRRLTITGVNVLQGSAPLHPDRPELGSREVRLEGRGSVELLVPAGDIDALQPGSLVRLKDLGNVELAGDGTARYVGDDLSVLKQGAKIVHWAPVDGMETSVLMPDGRTLKGTSEPGLGSQDGKVVQLERFGFVRIEADGDSIRGFFAHK